MKRNATANNVIEDFKGGIVVAVVDVGRAQIVAVVASVVGGLKS